jgi:hypothetical protein
VTAARSTRASTPTTGPSSSPEPEPIEEPEPEAADDTPVPTVRDGVLPLRPPTNPLRRQPSAEEGRLGRQKGPMRIRLLRSVIHERREHPTGAVVEFSDGLAESLIAGGVAEQVKARTAPPNIKARLAAPTVKKKG